MADSPSPSAAYDRRQAREAPRPREAPRSREYTPRSVPDDVLDAEILRACLDLMARGIYPGLERIATTGGVRRDRHRIGRSVARLEASGKLVRGPAPVVVRTLERAPRGAAVTCPISDADLRRYLKDRGSEAKGRAIGLHLFKCAACRERIPRGPSATDLEVRAALRRERDRRGWYVLCPQWEPSEAVEVPPEPRPPSRRLLEATEVRR